MSAPLCTHCLLPVRGTGHVQEVDGEAYRFCCYGCCLAYQVHRGHGEESEAAWLLIRLGAGAFLAMNIMILSLVLYSGTIEPGEAYLLQGIHVVLWALATAVIAVLGVPFARNAWLALLDGRATADSLVAVGAFAAYGYSAFEVATGGARVYFDTAAMVLVLFTLGRYLEALGRSRAARSVGPLLAAERAQATVVRDGRDIKLPARELTPGTIVRVRPGERVPVDGVVIEGRSRCDEAVLTGQAAPQFKCPGEPVYAGALNGQGQLLIRASAGSAASRWGEMGRQVREALTRKSVTGEIADRAAGIFIPAVALLAAGTTIYWSAHGAFDQALMVGLAVLVVACPCALGLAAPLATALGLSEAAQRGVLVRSGAVLERFARLRCVAFDKTGTLSSGDIRLATLAAEGVGEGPLLAHAAALAQGSEHPLARGIARAAGNLGLAVPQGRQIEAHPGEGVTGLVNGQWTAMGSRAFVRGLGFVLSPALEARAMAIGNGCTLVYVAWNARVRGTLALAEAPPAQARSVVAALNELGLATALLSGDTADATARLGQAVGISDCYGDLSPTGKVETLQAWAGRHGTAAMVGDGLNDGPVLAAANIGVAVGGATDFARESADVALPEGALDRLPWLIGLSRRVRRIILGNVAWALGYNGIALALAAAGMLQPVLAAAFMAGSSLLVVANSLRVSAAPPASGGRDGREPAADRQVA
jgi:Cu2+-exporting ATPase